MTNKSNIAQMLKEKYAPKTKNFLLGVGVSVAFLGSTAHAMSMPGTSMTANRPAPGGTISVRSNMSANSAVGFGHRFQTRTTGPSNTATTWTATTITSPLQSVHSPILTVRTYASNVQFTGQFEFARPGSNIWIILPNRTITVR